MKNKNLKKKRRVPELRFPEFSGEWEEKRLGAISIINKNKKIPDKFFYIDLESVNEGTLDRSLIMYNKSNAPSRARRVISKGDILYSTVRPYQNNNLYIDFAIEIPIVASTGFALIQSKIDNKFIYYYMCNNKYTIEVLKRCTGTSYPAINTTDLSNTMIIYPKHTMEQQKIGNFFYTIDKKLELQEEKIDTLKEYKKGMMQKIFSQEIRFKDDDGKDFPDWKEKRLGEVCKIRKGEQLNRKKFVENGKYYVLNGGREPSGYYNLWNTESNTISISEGGESCGYVTYNFERFWSGGHLYTLENLKESVNDKFLFQYLKKYEREIMRLRVGSGLPNIQKKDLDSFKIQIPSLLEQKKIANFLSAIDKKIELEEEKLENMKKFKKGLMQRMFV